MTNSTMETKSELIKQVEKLEKAKENALFCLNNANGLADMYGLSYWAGEVERLRKEIKSQL